MPSTDESLVAQATRLKDTEAFAELVRRYEQKILLLQRRLTGERSLAEDLAQETFLRAWQKLHTFSGSGSFGGWLASLSYNVFRAHWRKTRRQRDEVPLDDMEFATNEADQSGLADLDRLLGMLNRQDQVIMTLSYAYGLSTTEVGQVLDMPAGTIKARVHRAKAKIRERLDEPVPDPGTSGTQSPKKTPDASEKKPDASEEKPDASDHQVGIRMSRSSAIKGTVFTTPPAMGTLNC